MPTKAAKKPKPKPKAETPTLTDEMMRVIDNLGDRWMIRTSNDGIASNNNAKGYKHAAIGAWRQAPLQRDRAGNGGLCRNTIAGRVKKPLQHHGETN